MTKQIRIRRCGGCWLISSWYGVESRCYKSEAVERAEDLAAEERRRGHRVEIIFLLEVV